MDKITILMRKTRTAKVLFVRTVAHHLPDTYDRITVLIGYFITAISLSERVSGLLNKNREKCHGGGRSC
jgi:hypothetical protein